MQKTKIIDNLQLCDEERTFEGDLILQGETILKNAKVTVKGMLWVKNYGREKISMDSSTIIANIVLIDPVLEKYENSKIIGKECVSFSY